MTALRFNQAMIDVGDLDRSIAFYEKLGLTLIVNSPGNGYARFETGDDSGTFSLHTSENPVSAGASFYFEVDDVDANVAALEKAGLSFDAPPTDQSWGWREAWTRDPDGRRIAIYHAGENRRFPAWRLKSAPQKSSSH